MTTTTHTPPRPDLTSRLLLDQLTTHWERQLRPRLEGLTDDEYFWEPAPGAWSIRPRGTSLAPVQGGVGAFTVDFAFPEPDPAPVTTIAWRLAHVVVGVLAVRNAAHAGGPPASYETWEYAGTASAALAQLDAEMGRWTAHVSSLDTDRLMAPCGPSEGPWADEPFAALVLHLTREVVHHGAEVCLLRDLHAAGAGAR
ncbi:DinB family protein [Nocardioides sp. AX2bis]|uniref:DinB family protein n=1 Tax=Nocardioides sp. AX2bis TaxID=2653157 RepID=UPI0012EFC8A9|nr:DinB family protein [Nocardioides sp. AX2bis]VXB21667.1 DinB superfamily protein [Nocardioides sp. AX2bis]